MQLKPHQINAKQDILYSSNGLVNNRRAKFISACGTGKTFTALASCEEFILDIEKLDKSYEAFFYPTLALISQSFKTYINETRIDNYKPLFICSDKSIANIDDEDISLDEFKEEVGNYQVTTNEEDVIRYLQDDSIEHKVVFSTYQSSHILAKATMQLNISFNFSTFDEAHNIALKNNSKESAQTVILHDKDFPNEFGLYFECEKRLFMTATPKHFELKDEDNNEISLEETRLVYSMDDIRYFGEVAHEYSMRDAINDGVIADYQIIAITIDEEYIESFKNEFKIEDERLYDEVKAFAVLKAMEKYNINKTIAFNKTINRSKDFKQMISKFEQEIESLHIDGKMKHIEKAQILESFSNTKKSILSNSRLLGEGIDVPTVDMIALLSNSTSLTDIIQRVGRCQRIPVNYAYVKKGYIFIPMIVVLKEGQTQNELNKLNADVKNLYNIINSLSENDRQLRDYIKYKISNISSSDYEQMLDEVAFIMANKQHNENDKKRLNNLTKKIRIYEQCNNVKPIVLENINTLVKKDISYHTTKFSNTNDYNLNTEILNALSFIGATIINENYSWNLMLKKYQKFYKEYKREPKRISSDIEEMKLNNWIRSQRTVYNDNLMQEDRIKQILSVNANFFNLNDFKWITMFETIEEFYIKNNCYPNPNSKDKEEKKLGSWINSQKAAIKENKLDDSRKEKFQEILNKLGTKSDDTKWDEKYNQLQMFIDENQRLPKAREEGFKELGRWVDAQKSAFKKGNLSEERTNKLKKFITL